MFLFPLLQFRTCSAVLCVLEFFFSSSPQNKIKYGVSDIKYLSPPFRNFLWSACVAWSVKYPTSVQVMISRLMGLSLMEGFVLTGRSLELTSLSAPPPPFLKNKLGRKKERQTERKKENFFLREKKERKKERERELFLKEREKNKEKKRKIKVLQKCVYIFPWNLMEQS